jgi:outer membrane protein insertion porin family
LINGQEIQFIKKLNIKMRKLLFIIILSLFYTSTAFSEVVKKIDISGNNRVSDETIKIYGDVKVNQDYGEQDLNRILNNLFSTNFFEDVKIQLNNNILTIDLIEHPVINQLIILGEPSKKYKEQITKLMNSKEKESYIKINIAKDVEIIKQLYASLGFNFTEVETKIRKVDEANLDLIFEIKKGKPTRISKITFIGDKKVRDKRLRDIVASEEHKFWKVITRNTKFNQSLINMDIRLLANYYKSIGYYDVQIKSNSAELINKDGNIELIYSIDAGNRYVIKKIMTNADPVIDKNIFFPLNKEYQEVIGSYYSPFKIKKLLDSVDELIERNNLQFIEHNVEEIIENDSIVIKFNIYEGEKVLVERINILGNNITNESVIRSEMELDEGDPFTNLGLDKSVSNIKSRNIFKKVNYNIKDGSEKNLKTIDIIVEEKPTGEVSAGAGIGTNGGSFMFNVQENNYLGEGKNVGFEIEIDQDSLKGTLNYTDPNYDFLGNALNYYVTSSNNDMPDQGYENTIMGAGINTTFEQYKDVYTSLGIDATHDDLQTLDSASASLKKQAGTFNEISGNYGFSFDKRNRSFMPTEGSIISFNQSLPIYADKSFIANTFSVSSYKTLTEDVIGAGKFFISAINGLGSDDVRLSKRRGLSSRRLRGFEKGKVGPLDGKDHIGGNYAAALNFEANLPNLLPESTNTDFGFFLDFGNVWGVDYDSTIDDSNKIRSSAGGIMNWNSPLGPMNFTLSTNLSKASTDVTESFNFNLGTTF